MIARELQRVGDTSNLDRQIVYEVMQIMVRSLELEYVLEYREEGDVYTLILDHDENDDEEEAESDDKEYLRRLEVSSPQSFAMTFPDFLTAGKIRSKFCMDHGSGIADIQDRQVNSLLGLKVL